MKLDVFSFLAWAEKRHYNIKGRGGRLDCSRAANELLRLSLAAKNKLVLYLKPRGFTRNEGGLLLSCSIPSGAIYYHTIEKSL